MWHVSKVIVYYLCIVYIAFNTNSDSDKDDDNSNYNSYRDSFIEAMNDIQD